MDLVDIAALQESIPALAWPLVVVLLTARFLQHALRRLPSATPRTDGEDKWRASPLLAALAPVRPAQDSRQQDRCSTPALTDGGVVGDEADEGWQKGWGQWKYCGLRPDPLSSEDPPKYSSVDLDLPLPVLAAGEAEKLEQLRERVADFRSRGHRADLGTLLRFLRARKGNVAAAEAYLRQSVAYREKLGTATIDTDWNLEAFQRCLAPWWISGGIFCHSKHGKVVAVERIGRCDFPFVLDNIPWDLLIRIDALHIVRSLAALEEDAVRRRTPLGDAVLVMDLQGFGWHSFTPTSARAFGKLVQLRDMLMPATLGHIFVVNAPKSFAAAWAVVKHFLDPFTREKVQIAATREATLKLLREHIGNDAIPGFLGGGRSVDGDPECRKIIAPGGRVPRRALERFHRLIAEHGVKLAADGETPLCPDSQLQRGDSQREEDTCCGFSCLRRVAH